MILGLSIPDSDCICWTIWFLFGRFLSQVVFRASSFTPEDLPAASPVPNLVTPAMVPLGARCSRSVMTFQFNVVQDELHSRFSRSPLRLVEGCTEGTGLIVSHVNIFGDGLFGENSCQNETSRSSLFEVGGTFQLILTRC
jgi:hypothetical protein